MCRIPHTAHRVGHLRDFGFGSLTRLLPPTTVDRSASQDDPSPSLHPHYQASQLLRDGPPLHPASLLSQPPSTFVSTPPRGNRASHRRSLPPRRRRPPCERFGDLALASALPAASRMDRTIASSPCNRPMPRRRETKAIVRGGACASSGTGTQLAVRSPPPAARSAAPECCTAGRAGSPGRIGRRGWWRSKRAVIVGAVPVAALSIGYPFVSSD